MPTTDLRKFAWLSIATSLVTIVLKFGAFELSNSVSLWSDAMESLVNLAAGLVALWALWLAGQPADENHAFGHHKAEYFSSGAEGALILVAAVSIIWAALDRFFHPAALTQLGWSLVISFLAAGCNFVAARILLAVGKRHDSITLEADAHHLLTDVWTSLGIGTGLLLVIWAPGLAWLDPLLAMAVGANIMLTAYGLLRRSAAGLMDTALPESEIDDLRRLLAEALAGRGEILALRTRKSGPQRFIEATVGLPATMTVGMSHQVCDEIEIAIQGRFTPPPKIVVHVEPQGRFATIPTPTP